MNHEPVAYVVDDDASFRRSMAWLFGTVSIACKTYETGREFQQDICVDSPGCLILDLRLSAETGLEVFNTMLSRKGFIMPVMFMSGAGDIESAVKGMKLGAIDFLEKPTSPKELLHKVRNAFAEDARRRQEHGTYAQARGRMAALSDREREVIKLICDGLSSKQIATRLKISINTVANHRARILSKLQASSTADLMRIAMIDKAAPVLGNET
jgi:FixJ family two-component response regulator